MASPVMMLKLEWRWTFCIACSARADAAPRVAGHSTRGGGWRAVSCGAGCLWRCEKGALLPGFCWTVKCVHIISIARSLARMNRSLAQKIISAGQVRSCCRHCHCRPGKQPHPYRGRYFQTPHPLRLMNQIHRGYY